MRKSIDPMRRPEAAEGPLRALIVSMSFQPGIPWRVAPQQSPPPLPRPVTVWVRMEPLESFFQRTATCPYFLCLTTGVQPSLSRFSPPIGLPDAPRQRWRTAGDGDQTNVVGHQAVAEQPHTVLPAPLRRCFEIESPVFVAQKDLLTIVAPLGDVMRNALHDHTGHPRHREVRIIPEFGSVRW